MGYKTLLLVRHGEYTLTSTFPDHPDGSLTDRGQRQSEAVAVQLARLKIDCIYSSPLKRASETAQIISAHCPDVPLHMDDRLIECIPIVPRGNEHYFEGIPADVIAQGPAQAESAFDAFFAPLRTDEPNQVEVIVSHGNLIGYLVARALNAPVESWLRVDLGNGCLSEIRVREGLMKLIRHNDAEHLPLELRGQG